MKIKIKLFLITIILCSNIFAENISLTDARTAVDGWLKLSHSQLSATFNKPIDNIYSCSNSTGLLLYYVVNFENEGFVIVSPNSLIEPIIAFSGTGYLDKNPLNPLFDFLNADMNERIISLSNCKYISSSTNKFTKKWKTLFSAANNKVFETSISSIDDPRVDPLVKTRWSQSTAGGNACYNYYTPRYVGSTVTWDSGNSANYVCGCVATALAQFLRQREYPTTGIGTGSNYVSVSDSSHSSGRIWQNFRGGDDSGGAYLWNEMTLIPTSGSTETQRQQIGRLTYDAGVSVNMSYSNHGSGTDTLKCKDALVNVFNYANAIKGKNSYNELTGHGLYEMIIPNLDAKIPVILGITGEYGGHAIVCDGYGYNFSTLYHHLNMGWAGSDNAWYELPDIGTGYKFNKVYKCVYNIFETGTGEIISGRVLNDSGNPLSNVVVTADGITNTTDARGIYALVHVTSGTKTVSANKSGCIFLSTNVTVNTSINYSTSVGNVPDVNFTAVPEPFLFTVYCLSFGIYYLKRR